MQSWPDGNPGGSDTNLENIGRPAVAFFKLRKLDVLAQGHSDADDPAGRRR
jgi:hypothetical protein